MVEESKGLEKVNIVEEKEVSKTLQKQVIVLSIDIEATGLSKFKDTCVEIGITISVLDIIDDTFVLNKHLESFQGYARGRTDGNKMCDKAAEITGLSAVFIAGQKSLSLLFKNCIKHVNKVCQPFGDIERCMVAYNGTGYDIPLLCADLECVTENGAVHFFRQLCVEKMIDILFVSRKCLDSTILKRNAKGNCSFKLGDVYSALFDEKLDGAHGAIADAQAVTRLIIEHVSLNTYVAKMFKEDSICDEKENVSMMKLVRTSVKKFNSSNDTSKDSKRSVLEMLQKSSKKRKLL